MQHLPQVLRASIAASLLFAAVAGWAATSPEPLTDELLSSLQTAYARAVQPGERAEQHRELLGSLLRRVQRSHATEVDFSVLAASVSSALEALPAGTGDPGEVFGKAINAALRALDPYARYLSARAHADSQSDSGGSFVGLGIEVEPSEGLVRVVSPIAGGPAARAGLRAGDLIVQVDGRSLQGVALADAVASMRGEAGTRVSIKIRRAGSDEFEVALVRDTIRRQLVRWRLEGDALVLRLSSFSGPVSAAMAAAVAEAGAVRPPRAVVLDLRGNPGGLLREAIRVADAFLSQGEIASVRGRVPSMQRTWQADADELLPGVPMVVLVDRNSASASELVAAALQDLGRATVMGQRSYGKGSVQTTYPLGDGNGAIKLTTSLYYGPSGRTVNRSGVTPDVELLAASTAGAAAAPEVAAPEPVARPALRVAPARCAGGAAASHAAVSCALAFLQAGGMEAFAASVVDSVP